MAVAVTVSDSCSGGNASESELRKRCVTLLLIKLRSSAAIIAADIIRYSKGTVPTVAVAIE